MDLETVPDRVSAFITEELRTAPNDVQGLVEKVAMTAAAVTQNASVASAPQGSQAKIKHVDLVSLEPKEVLLILLLEGNLLRQQVVNVSHPATQSQLSKLGARFNAGLIGRASDEVRQHYDIALLGLEKELLGRVVAILDLYEKGSESLVVHDGVRNLVRQPEFAESSRLQQVLEVLEETRYLTLLLRQLIGQQAQGRARRYRAYAHGLQPDCRPPTGGGTQRERTDGRTWDLSLTARPPAVSKVR
jgi:heat-inducible transcriptional repressor